MSALGQKRTFEWEMGTRVGRNDSWLVRLATWRNYSVAPSVSWGMSRKGNMSWKLVN
jgi:hypothetical protein